IVIGCYSDPGLDALREMLTIPVIGPGASSLHLAAQLGTRISVLTPAGRGFGRVAARLRALALGDLLASVRGIGLSVMDLAKQKPGALDKAADAARVAVDQDGADVLVLGCMSMAFLPGICETLSERVGVPVVNPVVAALKTAEAVATMRISHSKTAWPLPKPQEIVGSSRPRRNRTRADANVKGVPMSMWKAFVGAVAMTAAALFVPPASAAQPGVLATGDNLPANVDPHQIFDVPMQ